MNRVFLILCRAEFIRAGLRRRPQSNGQQPARINSALQKPTQATSTKARPRWAQTLVFWPADAGFVDCVARGEGDFAGRGALGNTFVARAQLQQIPVALSL